MFHVKHSYRDNSLLDVSRETFYFNGSFDGDPAFLGYFLEIPFTLLILISDRSASVPGSKNRSVPSIFPPKRNTACFASVNSSSILPDL